MIESFNVGCLDTTIEISSKYVKIEPEKYTWDINATNITLGNMSEILVDYNDKFQIKRARWKAPFISNETEHRCVIPCAGFYFSESQRTRYMFDPNSFYLYMGGVCARTRRKSNSLQFSILTYHNSNFPLIVPRTSIKQYLSDANEATSLLEIDPSEVKSCLKFHTQF